MADKIDYVEFPSTDRTASSAFFQRAFGWSIVSYGPDYDGLSDAGIDGGVDQAAARSTGRDGAFERIDELVGRCEIASTLGER